MSVPLNRWPAWLRKHILACRMPERFKPEFSVKLPVLGTRALDPHAKYYFPRFCEDTREYVQAFCQENKLTA